MDSKDAGDRHLSPELLEAIAAFLPPNDVAASMRLLNQACRQLFAHATAIRLSQPVPRHAFAWRWGGPAFMKKRGSDMTLARRRQLLVLTAASGVLENYELAEVAAGCLPDAAVLGAAAAAGALPLMTHLLDAGCPTTLPPATQQQPEAGSGGAGDEGAAGGGGGGAGGSGSSSSSSSSSGRTRPHALCAAAEAGQQAACELLLDRGAAWSEAAVRAAARGGHAGLACWLRRCRPADKRDCHSGQLLLAVASGLGLPALQRLERTWAAEAEARRSGTQDSLQSTAAAMASAEEAVHTVIAKMESLEDPAAGTEKFGISASQAAHLRALATSLDAITEYMNRQGLAMAAAGAAAIRAASVLDPEAAVAVVEAVEAEAAAAARAASAHSAPQAAGYAGEEDEEEEEEEEDVWGRGARSAAPHPALDQIKELDLDAHTMSYLLQAAAGSPRADWREKVLWLEGCGYLHSAAATYRAAQRPDGAERLAWLFARTDELQRARRRRQQQQQQQQRQRQAAGGGGAAVGAAAGGHAGGNGAGPAGAQLQQQRQDFYEPDCGTVMAAVEAPDPTVLRLVLQRMSATARRQRQRQVDEEDGGGGGGGVGGGGVGLQHPAQVRQQAAPTLGPLAMPVLFEAASAAAAQGRLAPLQLLCSVPAEEDGEEGEQAAAPAAPEAAAAAVDGAGGVRPRLWAQRMGWRLLLAAAGGGHEECFRWLLACGAVRAPLAALAPTLLPAAASAGSLPLLNLLLPLVQPAAAGPHAAGAGLAAAPCPPHVGRALREAVASGCAEAVGMLWDAAGQDRRALDPSLYVAAARQDDRTMLAFLHGTLHCPWTRREAAARSAAGPAVAAGMAGGGGGSGGGSGNGSGVTEAGGGGLDETHVFASAVFDDGSGGDDRIVVGGVWRRGAARRDTLHGLLELGCPVPDWERVMAAAAAREAAMGAEPGFGDQGVVAWLAEVRGEREKGAQQA
ncbi:hypothetical protein HXX76_009850 [Chlamydomonas incerta]|uniref:Uncharacterized protein n=1 Tax=Chlamydomonas incerta TaxID=51695 RepID=A0A835SS75_CHLIN|nr:hypothetical protein HXX76_009850 [Chlamydomonas incerta]|eukprot:KAG2430876.1 hypothetical protein HXX76_009850 [Chlamydomonas incerta]